MRKRYWIAALCFALSGCVLYAAPGVRFTAQLCLAVAALLLCV